MTVSKAAKLVEAHYLQCMDSNCEVFACVARRDYESKIERLQKQLNEPMTVDFSKAVIAEAAHQRKRWGSEHDAGKTDADWFWLIGYLAGKALMNPAPASAEPEYIEEKKLHRIITVAAAACNWHMAVQGKTDMRPGIETPMGVDA